MTIQEQIMDCFSYYEKKSDFEIVPLDELCYMAKRLYNIDIDTTKQFITKGILTGKFSQAILGVKVYIATN